MVSLFSFSPSVATPVNNGLWTLKGFAGNIRHAEKEEKEKLIAIQEALGQPNAICAALLPIKKNDTWWAFAKTFKFNKQIILKCR
jgi:hypothetical protein